MDAKILGPELGSLDGGEYWRLYARNGIGTCIIILEFMYAMGSLHALGQRASGRAGGKAQMVMGGLGAAGDFFHASKVRMGKGFKG